MNPLLISQLRQLTGFSLSNYSDSFIERRIQSRMRRTGYDTVESYINFIKEHKEEIDTLIREFSVHVTHFFRDRAMYDTLMLESLFDLLKYKDLHGDRSLRIWSAGCSSGEEVYTIAIILNELLSSRIKDFSIMITGTDIDRNALEAARLGIYTEEAFKETEKEIIDKYFYRKGECFVIKDNIKSIAEFLYGDILGAKPKHLDVIFCRNVVIYFSKEVKERLFCDFHESLNHNGLLILGKTETLIGPARDKFELMNISERIYVKKLNA